MVEEEEKPLTQSELKEVREIIEADKRAKWLRANIRNVAVWVVAVITAITLTWDKIKSFAKALVQ